MRMIWCPPLYGKSVQIQRKRKKKVKEDEKKMVRQAVDEKEDWEREEKMEVDYRKMEEMVHKRFHKQLKVFGKV